MKIHIEEGDQISLLLHFTPYCRESREAYVDHSPEEIAHKAIEIVREVVSQHAARQQANSVNRGTFA